MGCNDSKLKGSKRYNNESHLVIIDWILFPKMLLKGSKKIFWNNWENLNLAWILDNTMKLLLIFLRLIKILDVCWSTEIKCYDVYNVLSSGTENVMGLERKKQTEQHVTIVESRQRTYRWVFITLLFQFLVWCFLWKCWENIKY